MNNLKLGSLFTGYGGLEMGINQVLPAKPLWTSDIDTGACKIIAHRYPGILNLGDITRVNWDIVPRVDILAGGFPCQDVSEAGENAGLTDGTRTGLWTHMLKAIKTLQPKLVIAENVKGLRNAPAQNSHLEPCAFCLGTAVSPAVRALGAVLADLASIRYDAKWTSLRASDLGLCHARERIFIVAWPANTNPASFGLHRRRKTPTRQGRPLRKIEGHSFDIYREHAETIKRHAITIGRLPPSPTVPTRNGRPKLNTAFTEWVMALPEGWVTEVPRLGYGAQLKALGNGVIPTQAAAAITRLLED